MPPSGEMQRPLGTVNVPTAHVVRPIVDLHGSDIHGWEFGGLS